MECRWDTSFWPPARGMGFREASGDHPLDLRGLHTYLLCDGCLKSLGLRGYSYGPGQWGRTGRYTSSVSHYTGVGKAGPGLSHGERASPEPSQVTPRTGETTRFPGAEGGNPGGQEVILWLWRETRQAKEGKIPDRENLSTNQLMDCKGTSLGHSNLKTSHWWGSSFSSLLTSSEFSLLNPSQFE